MKTIANFKELLASANNDLLELLLRAVSDEKLRSECLNDHYSGGWRLTWLDESKKSEFHPIIPEDSLCAFFSCALAVLKNRGHKYGVLKYLELLAAPPYDNFHASTTITSHYIRMLRNEKENANNSFEDLITKAYQCGKRPSRYHHDTPSYLLSAHVSFCIAQCIEKQNRDRANVFYEDCYRDLLIAQQLETFCADKIESAYLGKGIAASNQWGCRSIVELISGVVVYLPDSHFFHCKKRAETAANKMAEEIIDLHYTPGETEEKMATIQFF